MTKRETASDGLDPKIIITDTNPPVTLTAPPGTGKKINIAFIGNRSYSKGNHYICIAYEDIFRLGRTKNNICDFHAMDSKFDDMVL